MDGVVASKVHRAPAGTKQSFSHHVPVGVGRPNRLVVGCGGRGLYGSCSSGMHRCTLDPWMSGIIKISGDINPTCGSSCEKYSRIKSLAI